MSYTELIAALVGIWLFSRWRPITINYFKNYNELHADQMSSGASLVNFESEEGPPR